MNDKATSIQRAEAIVKVRAGLMSASQAAASLGVSRKTYYEWEKKGLQGMLRDLEDKPAGRSAEEKSGREELLERQVKELGAKLQVAEQTAEIRAVLRLMEGADSKKKPRR